jgi:hypothetical protein
MSYQSLIREAWKSGNFSVPASLNSEEVALNEKTRFGVQKELEAIIEREAADASACLAARKEGVMKLAPFVKFREEKFGAVLFETRSEKVYTLSPTGVAVMREIIAGVDSGSLLNNLKEKYEDTTGNMEKEAIGFLGELKGKGLIVE